MDTERVAVNKQEQTTTKQQIAQKMHADKLHTEIGHLGEYRMCDTPNHLHYILKGVLDVCKYCATVNIKHKMHQKVADERDFKTGEMVYLEIISQKKPSCVGSNNWNLLQDSDTKQKWSFFTNTKKTD